MDFQQLIDNDPLDPSSNVTKIVPNSKVYDGTKVDACVLKPRAHESDMSVNWLEFDGDSELNVCLKKVMAICGKKLNITNQWLPVFNVQKAIEFVKSETPDNRILKILYKPEYKPDYEYDDPSHAGVFGYSHEDAMIGDLISEVVESLHKAKDCK